MITPDLSINGARSELGGINPWNYRHTRNMAHRSTQLNSYSRAKDSSLWVPCNAYPDYLHEWLSSSSYMQGHTVADVPRKQRGNYLWRSNETREVVM